MANAERNIIPGATPKRRGRPAKLKAVEDMYKAVKSTEPVEEKQKQAKTKKQFTGVFLSEKNFKYLKEVNEKSLQPMSALINLLVDNARAVDLLNGTPLKEPSAIKKAREALAKWDKELARKK